MQIEKSTFQFLKKLSKNNNREWFTEHKPEFDSHNFAVKQFFSEVNGQLINTDQIENHKVFRIYRDVRFSKDKTPYKTKFNGYFRRATEALRGSYVLNIQPGNSYAGGGLYGPNPADLMRIRKEFEMDDSEIRTILNAKKFKQLFGELQGVEVKTAPRGFHAEHPAIDLIKKKQFYVFRSFSDEEVLSAGFSNDVVSTFKAIRPYFDYMSEVLTTDLNGESTLENH